MIFTDRERRLLTALLCLLVAGYLLSALRATGVYSADAFFSNGADSAKIESLASDAGASTRAKAADYATIVTRSEAESHFHDGFLDVNLADSLELIRLPGIGPALAGRILEIRSRNNLFTRLEELRQVKGIGEKRLAALRGYLTIHYIGSDSIASDSIRSASSRNHDTSNRFSHQ